ncbi:MAG: trypsin-like peptidase domain-containing protein [Planctomycetes bacterium]|nr:trypsin-like peptidase domain-containing protein [Planctomycetota bacterium]
MALSEDQKAQIFRVEVNHSGPNPGLRAPKFGTAFRVADDLVMTALHVVRRPGVPDLAPEIRVAGRPAESIWPASADVATDAPDLAVLKVTGLGAGLPFTVAPPAARGRNFVSAGFPATEDGGTLFPFSGSLESDDTLHNIDRQPERPEKWHGVSGAPIVVGGIVVGLARAWIDGWLDALRVAVIDAATFDRLRSLPGWPMPRHHDRLRAAVQAAKADDVVWARLCPTSSDPPIATAEELVDHLVSAGLQKAIDHVLSAHGAFVDDLGRSGTARAKIESSRRFVRLIEALALDLHRPGVSKGQCENHIVLRAAGSSVSAAIAAARECRGSLEIEAPRHGVDFQPTHELYLGPDRGPIPGADEEGLVEAVQDYTLRRGLGDTRQLKRAELLGWLRVKASNPRDGARFRPYLDFAPASEDQSSWSNAIIREFAFVTFVEHVGNVTEDEMFLLDRLVTVHRDHEAYRVKIEGRNE